MAQPCSPSLWACVSNTCETRVCNCQLVLEDVSGRVYSEEDEVVWEFVLAWGGGVKGDQDGGKCANT